MDMIVLNDGGDDSPEPSCADDDAPAALQRGMLALSAAFITPDGRRVDYLRMAASPLFADLAAAARRLRRLHPHALSVDQRRAAWINIYNALTLHAIVAASASAGAPLRSVTDVPRFWAAHAYRVGGHALSLDDIEHGVLRGNRPHPASLRGAHWGSADPRGALSVPLDPRVHFALVCGAAGCPAIRVYSADNLERGLSAAAAAFCDGCFRVSDGGGVRTSQLVQWYGADFGDTQVAALRTLVGYMSPGAAREALQGALEAARDAAPGLLQRAANAVQPASRLPRGPVAIEFTPYDWSLNAADA